MSAISSIIFIFLGVLNLILMIGDYIEKEAESAVNRLQVALLFLILAVALEILRAVQ